MPFVFISYRRADASGSAGRLYDALTDHFGSGQVLMDVYPAQPGERFTAVIDRAVGTCDVVIAVIGPVWHRRLEHPDDFVRQELELALASGHVRVIPALVGGARMPSRDALPASLAPLVMRQAIELGDATWHTDVERLICVVET